MPSFRRFLLLSFLSFTSLHSTTSQATDSTAPVQSDVGLIYPTPCPQYIQIITMYGVQQYGIPCCMTKDSICNNNYIPVCTPIPNCTGDSCYRTKTNLCHACTDPDVSVYIMGACPSKLATTSSSPSSSSSSSSGSGGSKPSTTGSSSASTGGSKPSSTGSSGSGSTSTTPTKPKGPVKKTRSFVNKSKTTSRRVVLTPKKKSKK